jgi:hypothetical protein
MFGDQVPDQKAADRSQHQVDKENNLLRKAVLDQGRSEEWTHCHNGYNEGRVEADETRHVSDDM